MVSAVSCGCGGIGRRAWFRSMYPQGCGGSSPFSRRRVVLLKPAPVKKVLIFVLRNEICAAACGCPIRSLSMKSNHPSSFFKSRLVVDIGKCTGCAACKKICQTKALDLFAYIPDTELPPKTGEPRLRAEIKNSECAKCNRCLDFCSQKAIKIHRPFLAKVLGLNK